MVTADGDSDDVVTGAILRMLMVIDAARWDTVYDVSARQTQQPHEGGDGGATDDVDDV